MVARNETAIAPAKPRPLPDIAVKPLLGVLFQRRGDAADVFGREPAVCEIRLLGKCRGASECACGGNDGCDDLHESLLFMHGWLRGF
jgi:hypothetical protein